MKKKNIIISLLVLIFITLLPSIVFFVGNLSFYSWNFMYSGRIDNFLQKYFDNDILKEKKWDYLYRLWKYEDALQKYFQVKCEKRNECARLFHNIWNTYYKYWEVKTYVEKINLWQKSLEFYQKSLNLKYDEETKANYDFVKKKLEELLKNKKDEEKKQEEEQKKREEKQNKEQEKKNEEEKKQEEKKEEQPKEESTWNWQWQEKWQSSSTWNWQQQNQPQNTWSWQEQVIPKWPSMWLGWNEEEAQKELTKDEIDAIKWYLKSLSQEEKENMRLNKPQKDTWNMYDDFFNFEEWGWDDYDW